MCTFGAMLRHSRSSADDQAKRAHSAEEYAGVGIQHHQASYAFSQEQTTNFRIQAVAHLSFALIAVGVLVFAPQGMPVFNVLANAVEPVFKSRDIRFQAEKSRADFDASHAQDTKARFRNWEEQALSANATMLNTWGKAYG